MSYFYTMNISFWEQKAWFNAIDYAIVGSGIVGLTCALQLRKRFPTAKILILERGKLPNGASTKNAGFACFGSISEILEDLKSHTEEEVKSLIKQRLRGLSQLRDLLGDATIDYQELGGYELFTTKDHTLYKFCLENITKVNELLKPIFNRNVFSSREDTFGFKQTQSQIIFNACEGQIDTGKMMVSLLQKVQSQGIKVLNSTTVETYAEDASGVDIVCGTFQIRSKKMLIATNGFASSLGIDNIRPARAQVLVTRPITNLKVKGTFHLDKGYYYFRNIDNRILLGGGRNLDFKTEETTEMGQTDRVQNELERLLKEVILPDIPFLIDMRWSGVMGVGTQKKPIVKKLSDHVYCGVRLGGMGVAIGSLVGTELADLVTME